MFYSGLKCVQSYLAVIHRIFYKRVDLRKEIYNQS
jgi:hypothetical protein